MGKFLKYIIPFLVAITGIATFQNCGQKLQANGDPYENRIQLDDPFMNDPDNSSGAEAAPALGFTVEVACTSVSTNAVVKLVNLGQWNGSDAALVQLSSGPLKRFKWPEGQSPLVLNSPITNSVTVKSLEYDGSSKVLHALLLVNGQSAQEDLSCQ